MHNTKAVSRVTKTEPLVIIYNFATILDRRKENDKVNSNVMDSREKADRKTKSKHRGILNRKKVKKLKNLWLTKEDN
jgi:hypothetical protein